MDGWTLPNMMGESSGFSFMLHLTLSRVCGSAEKGLLCLLLTPALLFGSDHEFIHLKQFHLAWVLFQLVCLVDCRVTWSMQSVPEGGWGRCVEYPGSNSELLDWLTVHLQCISVFNRSLECVHVHLNCAFSAWAAGEGTAGAPSLPGCSESRPMRE